MAFAVEDFEDLLKLLDEHPEWRARLRSTVLGDDWQDLPQAVRDLVLAQQRTEERVEQLAARVEELAAAQQRTEERVEQLAARVEELAAAQQRTEARVEELAARIEELAAAQQRTEVRVEELAESVRRLTDRIDVAVEALTSRMDDMTTEFGYMYEMIFERRAAGIFQDWLIRPRPVSYDDLSELQTAREAGVITSAEMKQVGLLDILLSGREPSTREPTYLAVEVSRTVNPDDVDRATARADVIRRAGLSVRAAVGGRRISHEAQQLAEANGVIVAILTAQPA